MINLQLVIWCLEELASRKKQERLWLSDCSSGEVSSFEETVCQLFDDSGVSRELRSGKLRLVFPKRFCDCLEKIDAHIGKVPQQQPPLEIINHPEMEIIRGLCKELLQIIANEQLL